MSTITFKRNMNIGTISAEDDSEFLAECFLETPEYEELLEFPNKKMILLGRTGSGKTALISKIKEEVNVYIEIKPDTFALQYILNVPFIKRLKDENVNLDIFYKFLWLHELISQIIKHYFAYKNRKFVDELTQKVSDLGRIQQLKKYLYEYDGIFFDEGSTEKITKEIEKEATAIAGTEFTQLKGKFTDNLKQEIQSKTSQYIHKKQIKQLKNIISLFKEYFINNRQKHIVVAIDNLDMNWIDDESKYQLIDALLNAIREFIDVPNIKILMALRADLLAKTCEVTKRQNEKDESLTLRINWTPRMIEELLDKRINYLFCNKYKKNTKLSFKDLFNFKINNQECTEYIIERTMLRPRDAIDFINKCISEADSCSLITIDNVLEAEKNYRSFRLIALDHEWASIYGDVNIYIQVIYYFGNTFEYRKLLETENYSTIETILYEQMRKRNDSLLNNFFNTNVQDKYRQERNIKELLNIMFTMGLIGIRRNVNDTLNFSTPLRPNLTEMDFTENLSFEIHPLFRK